MTASPLSPVIKVVTVKAGPEAAFRRFTREMSSWWPLASHSLGQQDAETVTMEEWVGGRIVERIRGGRESIWGTVTVWEPPHRVAFTWHPAQSPDVAQDVEVRFRAVGERTRVELEHRGFERLGAMAKRAWRAYGLGWAYVLGFYTGRRGLFMLAMGGLTNIMLALNRRKRASAA